MLVRFTALALIACASSAFAQLSVLNGALGGASQITGTSRCHRIDSTNFQSGAAAVVRDASPSSACFFPSGWAIDPTVSDDLVHPAGFTIMFWYRPGAATTFQYLLGDRAWTGAAGAFRVFQNGVAGPGNVIVRGPLTQVATLGAPLTTATNSSGFVHLTLRYDSTNSTITWLVNGVPSNSAVTAGGITGTGTDLTFVGYNGSSAPGPQGQTDDVRFYNHARSDTEILAEWNVPFGATNIPTQGAYEFDFSVEPLIAKINNTSRSGVMDSAARIAFPGDVIEWAGETSPGTLIVGSAIINIETSAAMPGSSYGITNRTPPAMAVPGPYDSSFLAPGLSDLEVGHALSAPANPLPVIIPDGLGIAPLILGPFGLTLPLNPGYTFSQGAPTSGAPTHPAVPIPAAGIVAGDRLQIQFVGVGASGQLGITNRVTFLIEEPDTSGDGAHATLEARGSSIQNAGFWEIHNTGDKNILSVTIDLSPVNNAWDPAGLINSGGTLGGGDSFRFLSDLHTGYTLFTPVGTTNLNEAIKFDFTDFQPGEIAAFDSDLLTPVNGDILAGATAIFEFDDGLGGTILVNATLGGANPTEQLSTVSF